MGDAGDGSGGAHDRGATKQEYKDTTYMIQG